MILYPGRQGKFWTVIFGKTFKICSHVCYKNSSQNHYVRKYDGNSWYLDCWENFAFLLHMGCSPHSQHSQRALMHFLSCLRLNHLLQPFSTKFLKFVGIWRYLKVYDKENELQKTVLEYHKTGKWGSNTYMKGKQLLWCPNLFLDFVLKTLELQATGQLVSIHTCFNFFTLHLKINNLGIRKIDFTTHHMCECL